jgi:hypothetical protein
MEKLPTIRPAIRGSFLNDLTYEQRILQVMSVILELADVFGLIYIRRVKVISFIIFLTSMQA